MTTLQRGEIVPHFQVSTVGGIFDYATIWQQKHLVLVTIPPGTSAEDYVRSLSDRAAEFVEQDSVCVVTHDPMRSLPTPGALVADRWGEVVHVVTPSEIGDLPTPQELLGWVEYLEHRCPECEGEAK